MPKTPTPWPTAIRQSLIAARESRDAAARLIDAAPEIAALPELLSQLGVHRSTASREELPRALEAYDWSAVRRVLATWGDSLDAPRAPHLAGIRRIISGIAGDCAEYLALRDGLAHYGATGVWPVAR